MSKQNLKILFLEDEADQRLPITEQFEKRDCDVKAIATLPECEQAWKINARDYDVIVLDRRIENGGEVLDSIDLLKQRRGEGDNTPVLMLTAHNAPDERVEGLALQAEYVGKPFHFEELMARIRNVYLSHQGTREQNLIETGTVQIDKIARTVHLDKVHVPFSPQEFDIFLYLVENEGEVITKRMLLEKIWGYSFDTRTGVVEASIKRLRDKLIEINPSLQLIKNEFGKGYIFEAHRLFDK